MERIELKQELKLIKALNSIFTESSYPIKDLDIEKDLGFMDVTNVSMIVLKSEQLKDIFKRFVDKGSNIETIKIPELDYKTDISIKSKYSIEYLSKIIKCFESIGVNPIIQMKSDYPMILIGEHFNFILAPRADNY